MKCRDFLAWFQEPEALIISGYVRMVMIKDSKGRFAPAALQTSGGNYSFPKGEFDCQGAFLARAKVVAEGKVPAEIREKRP